MRRVVLASALLLAFVSARQRATRPATPPAGPTFSKEVVRIFQANCQTCHHPGDIGPFSLMTYADAAPHATDIKVMTKTRQMPPWKPVQSCGVFDSPRILSQEDIDTIVKWVDSGAPEGNRADLPAPLDFTGGWALGSPDQVLSSDKPYTPPATGDMYRCFSIPANATSDKYVTGIDIKPGDRQTVHHVIAFIDTNGSSANLTSNDGTGGYPCFGGPGFQFTNLDATVLGGWAPGYRAVTLPEGVAFLLPKNSRVVIQVHYHPHGPAPLPDQTQVGLYYAKSKPNKLMRVLPLINETFKLRAGDPNARVTQGQFIPLDAHIWLIAPHMHLLGRKISATATSLLGESACLINIDDWDFNWQGMYRFKDPVPIKYGTTLSLEALYDNSANNPRNPNDPPKDVYWGEATTDEMCIVFFGFTVDTENYATGQVADMSWLPRLKMTQ